MCEDKSMADCKNSQPWLEFKSPKIDTNAEEGRYSS
eukprot:gene37410-46152_t